MEMKPKKPPQIKLESDEAVRIDETGNVGDVSNINDVLFSVYDNKPNKPVHAQSDQRAAFFEADNSKPKNVGGVKPTSPERKAAPASKSKKELNKEKANAKPLTPAEIERKKQALKERIKRRNEQLRTFSHVFGSVLLIVFIISVSAFLSQFLVRAFLDFTGINTAEYEITIEIPAGATTEEVADALHKYDIITLPGFFAFYSRFTENDGDYLHGLFNFSSTMSYNQLIYTLQNRPQSTETVKVKIVEGMTAREIGELLEENEVCRSEDFMEFYQVIKGRFNFERRLTHNPLKLNQMEGYLFPDTYEFFIVNGLSDDPEMDTSIYAEAAARTIFSHYNSQITAEMYRKIGDLGDTLPIEFGLDELMTIASMVQWEAAEPEDMQKVASVFLNRLRNPDTFSKLQSDVTDKYIEESIKPARNDSNSVWIEQVIEAFDTYSSGGLPPGPVCNPGLVAILAVIDASSTDYFYFCANVETGEMFFAETLAQHRENLEEAGIDEDTARD
jgi:UPF0755 protein